MKDFKKPIFNNPYPASEPPQFERIRVSVDVKAEDLHYIRMACSRRGFVKAFLSVCLMNLSKKARGTNALCTEQELLDYANRIAPGLLS